MISVIQNASMNIKNSYIKLHNKKEKVKNLYSQSNSNIIISQAGSDALKTRMLSFGSSIDNTFTTDLNNLELFKGLDTRMISSVMKRIGIEDIEYSEKAGYAKLYLKSKNNFTYNMSLGRLEGSDTIAGLVSKEYNNGSQELYLVRFDFIETNKSKKMQVSFMPIVQNGVNDDSETEKKDLKSITVNGMCSGNAISNVTKMEQTGSLRGAYSGLFSEGRIRGSWYSPTQTVSEMLEKICGTIQVSNSDARRVTTFSLNKDDELSIQGSNIGKQNTQQLKRKHPDWNLVKGPNNVYYEVPPYMVVSEEGFDGSNLLDIMTSSLKSGSADDVFGYNYYGGRICYHDYKLTDINNFLNNKKISKKADLHKIIDILSRMKLKGIIKDDTPDAYPGKYLFGFETLNSRVASNLDIFDDVIEVARNMLLAIGE